MNSITVAATTDSSTPTQKRNGRPAKQDWESLRDEIEGLIEAGLGHLRLGRYYGITAIGMRCVLKRLGLKTLQQQRRQAQLERS